MQTYGLAGAAVPSVLFSELESVAGGVADGGFTGPGGMSLDEVVGAGAAGAASAGAAAAGAAVEALASALVSEVDEAPEAPAVAAASVWAVCDEVLASIAARALGVAFR